MKILELFCGMGGVAEAVRQTPGVGSIHQAIDIDRQSAEIYALNFSQQPLVATIESPQSWQAKIDWRQADTWWLSPPCQPYCRRGNRSATDPRRAAFLQTMRVLESAGDAAPARIAMENVPEFQHSADHVRWSSLLKRLGYRVTEHLLCPTDWGIPNRRRRYYLTAWRGESMAGPPPQVRPPATDSETLTISQILEVPSEDSLWVAADIAEAYSPAMHIIDANDLHACTACFTSGYGKSLIQAGSYLRIDGRLRRFSPLEIQRLLGFSAVFRWPATVSTRRRWKLLGNSLSIPIVRELLRSLRNTKQITGVVDLAKDPWDSGSDAHWSN